MRSKLIIVTAAVLALAGCATEQGRLATGTAAGAAAGNIAAAAVGGDRTTGTILGAAAGLAVAGINEEQNRVRQCTFRYADGSTRVGPCPTN